MSPVNADVYGPAVLAMSQGISAFQSYLPKISEVRQASVGENPDIAADVRVGEVAACTLTLGVGMIASSLTGSSVPAAIALVVCIVMVALYESILIADRPLERKTSLSIVRND